MTKILVIDDDEQVLGILRSYLSTQSFDVETARNGVEGLRMYRENPADLVISDIVMPEKEGLQTIQELKLDYPNVKIIAMSGGGRIGTEDYLRVAELHGARRILRKPFKLADVLGLVQSLLDE